MQSPAEAPPAEASAAPRRRRLVVVESPFAGEIERNRTYLQRCIRDSILRGESPFASHQMYVGALDDNDPQEREQGIEAGFAFRFACAATVVYEDYGISRGMELGIAHATRASHVVEHRRIGPNDAPSREAG